MNEGAAEGRADGRWVWLKKIQKCVTVQAFQRSQYEWWSCRWLSAAAIRKVGERIRRHTERNALKKTPKKQKRAHMAFGVWGLMFNPQCQVKEQVPNFAAEVHQLTNVGWACVGEDAQSLRLCEVGLPVSFYFKPTGDLFLPGCLKVQTRKQYFFFIFYFYYEIAHSLMSNWLTILIYFNIFFFLQRIGHRRGAKCLNICNLRSWCF